MTVSRGSFIIFNVEFGLSLYSYSSQGPSNDFQKLEIYSFCDAKLDNKVSYHWKVE